MFCFGNVIGICQRVDVLVEGKDLERLHMFAHTGNVLAWVSRCVSFKTIHAIATYNIIKVFSYMVRILVLKGL